MSPVILKENNSRNTLQPLTLVRSVLDLRVGILTLREKWRSLTGMDPVVTTPDDPQKGLPVNLIPGAVLPKQDLPDFGGDHRTLDYPWQLTACNDWAIRQDFTRVTRGRLSEPIPSHVRTTHNGSIFLEKGSRLEHCVIHAADGPVYIGKNAHIMDGAMLRGPVSIGEGAVVKMGAAIYGATTIGPYCTVGGEIKNSILMDFSNKAHEGYLGDAVIGQWCNLGAGTSCSNLKNTGRPVRVWSMFEQAYREAGFKCGVIMGDHCRTAIHTAFNTGTVVGLCANVFGSSGLSPTFIPSFTWGLQGDQRYEWEKAIRDIETWMGFKGFSLQSEQIEALQKVYENP